MWVRYGVDSRIGRLSELVVKILQLVPILVGGRTTDIGWEAVRPLISPIAIRADVQKKDASLLATCSTAHQVGRRGRLAQHSLHPLPACPLTWPGRFDIGSHHVQAQAVVDDIAAILVGEVE